MLWKGWHCGSSCYRSFRSQRGGQDMAFLTKRKGNKKFAMYDLVLDMKWEAKFTNKQNKKVKGKISISDFTSSLDREDWIFTVTCDESGDLKEEAKSHACELQDSVYEQLEQLILELNEILSVS
eukprot:TRINITY_DN1100_c0_g1_i3.p3 TRINITY_DN1100_c0_g1~~TRINITY_DN1100_c0_g1_i3.p3  ORF type:complete len:124 (+),score=11.55 TRINITY_DN1100_c0_g1_i3:233-604(+)